MKFLSRPGSKSTWFERILLASVFIGGIVYAFSGLHGQVERHLVFRSASAQVFNQCVDKSNYAMYKFFAHNREELYTCIAESKDNAFQQAAARYMLQNAIIIPDNTSENTKK